MSGSAAGEFFMPGDWFSEGELSGSSVTETSATTTVSASHTSETEFYGESAGEADVPIFIPVPFKELSSVQYFSLDEQLTQMTAALKEQFPRHCFIKIHGQATQPLLVPFIRRHYTPPTNLRWYEEKVLAKIQARRAVEVDNELKAAHDAAALPVPATRGGEVVRRTPRSRRTRWEDLLGRE